MMKKLLLITFLTLFSTTLITAQNLPTNPSPGKCYVKCITKDVFDTVTESIQVQPSYQTLSVVPATYKTVEERIGRLFKNFFTVSGVSSERERMYKSFMYCS